MLTSTVEGQIVRHLFKGSLDLRDIQRARQYVETNLKVSGVLWDFQHTVLDLPDAKYEVIAGSSVNQETLTSQVKRAFLVKSEGHFARVQAVLKVIPTPWPWAIFSSEEDALAWLAE